MVDLNTNFLSAGEHHEIISCPTVIQDVCVYEQQVVQCVVQCQRKNENLQLRRLRFISQIFFFQSCRDRDRLNEINMHCDSDNPKHHQHNDCYSAAGFLLCTHI